MKLVYFAWVRERIGLDEETVDSPARTVSALLDWLERRGPGYARALADRRRIRVAVNQAFVAGDAPVGPDDEIAIFPPVTGG